MRSLNNTNPDDPHDNSSYTLLELYDLQVKNGFKFTIDQYNEAKKHLENYTKDHCFSLDLSVTPSIEDNKPVDVRKEMKLFSMVT